MSLTYSLTKKDSYHFHSYTTSNLTTTRIFNYMFLILFALQGFYIGFGTNNKDDLSIRIITGILLSLLFIISWMIIIFLIYRLVAIVHVNVIKNINVICEHIVSINDDELIETTQYENNRIKISALNKIIEFNNYTFIYLSNTSAHIIPKYKIDSNEYSIFYNNLVSIAKSYNIKIVNKRIKNIIL